MKLEKPRLQIETIQEEESIESMEEVPQLQVLKKPAPTQIEVDSGNEGDENVDSDVENFNDSVFHSRKTIHCGNGTPR